MKRSIRKAVAFFTFIALMLQLFVTSGAEAVRAAEGETKFYVDEYGNLEFTDNSSNLMVPSDFGEHVELAIYGRDVPVESVTFEKGITSVSIWGGYDLEEVVFPEGLDYVSIVDCPKLKNLTVPDSVSFLSLNSVAIESLDVPDSVSNLSLYFCNELSSMDLKKGLSGFYMYDCPNLKVTIPSTVNDLSCDRFDNITIDPENPYFLMYEGCLYKDDVLIFASQDKEVIDVKPGTKAIGEFALCAAYAVTTVNIPDSVESIGKGAFAGARSLKKLNLPKGLLCIYDYAFEGIGAETLKIPASVKYVEPNAFGGYMGNVKLENNKGSVLKSKNGAIYSGDASFLMFYPKDRTKLKLDFGCLTLAYESINGCDFKKLNIPEGIQVIDVNLSACRKLKSINIPASVRYIDSFSIGYMTPGSLEKYTVAADNQYYTSYQGCLYSKDKTMIYSIPRAKEKVKIARGCITVPYYCFGNRDYNDDLYDTGYTGSKIDIVLPGTVRSIDGLYYVANAKVECGTTVCALIDEYNSWSYSPVTYEFVESSKAILRKIVVSDDIRIDLNDKGEYVTYSLPTGLKAVKAFTPIHEGNNTYVKISYTSSDKSVCKVSKKTGKLTPVKKGEAVIKVRCELTNGSKKTFKVKVTVK